MAVEVALTLSVGSCTIPRGDVERELAIDFEIEKKIRLS